MTVSEVILRRSAYAGAPTPMYSRNAVRTSGTTPCAIITRAMCGRPIAPPASASTSCWVMGTPMRCRLSIMRTMRSTRAARMSSIISTITGWSGDMP